MGYLQVEARAPARSGASLEAELDLELAIKRVAFAGKVRAARAILGLNQEVFGRRIGLTQRSVHRIEQAAVQPKARTVYAIEQFLRLHGISFEDLGDGGFRLVVPGTTLSGG
jgi:DNA-binding XRE family transcriptional regulator